MEFHPINDNIVISRNEADSATSTGLYVPPSTLKPAQGTVVAVGPGLPVESGGRVCPTVEVGDTVVFSKFGQISEVDSGEDKFLIMSERNILAVLGPKVEFP